MKLNCRKIESLRKNSIDEDSKLSKKHMTINSLSERVKVSNSVLHRAEYDEYYNIGVFTLQKIADFYNIPVEDLLIY